MLVSIFRFGLLAFVLLASSVALADDLAPARIWTDSTGKFRIKAALIAVTDTEVTLRKADMSEMKLAIDKLSVADQRFVATLAAKLKSTEIKPGDAGVGGIGEVPPAADAEVAVLPERVLFSATELKTVNEQVDGPAAIEPDPLPATVLVKPALIPVAQHASAARFQELLPVGGRDCWVLAAVDDGPAMAKPTRLLWASLQQGKIVNEQALPAGECVLDYHAPSHRLLTATGGSSALKGLVAKAKGGSSFALALTIWEVLPTDKAAKALMQWEVAFDTSASQSPWAKFATADLVLHLEKYGRIKAWDISSKQAKYELNYDGGADRGLLLSPGRKYFFLPTSKGAKIFDAQSLKLLSVLPTSTNVMSMGISEDGKSAAVTDYQNLRIWDLTQPGLAPKVYGQPLSAASTRTHLHFVGSRVAARSPGIVSLFSLERNFPLWNYNLEGGQGVQGHTSCLVGDHLLFGVRVPQSQGKALAIGAVQLPGPGVDAAEKKLVRVEPITFVEPGTGVQLIVNAGGHNAQVQAALEKKIADNGWKLVAKSDVVITATMEIGKQRTTSYKPFTGPEQTVTIQEYKSSLVIKAGGKQAYFRSTSNADLPRSIFLSADETLQKYMDRRNGTPDPAYFGKLDIPKIIQDTTPPQAAGTSLVGSKGLETLRSGN